MRRFKALPDPSRLDQWKVVYLGRFGNMTLEVTLSRAEAEEMVRRLNAAIDPLTGEIVSEARNVVVFPIRKRQ